MTSNMGRATSLVLFLISLFLLHQSSTAQSPVKGGYWFQLSEFPVADINSALFTHLFCAFAGLNRSNNQVTVPAAFSNFTATVRRRNPSVKTLLSIGGGSSRPADFAAMAARPASRKSFIASSIRLARSNSFDGLDLDWEYPQTATDMTNFGSLLAEWRSAVNLEARRTRRTPLLLTAAVHFSNVHETETYPVPQIRDNLDWANVMAYDFKGPNWSGAATGAPAALVEPGSRFSGSVGIENWIAAGLGPRKLVLGLPFYGYAWKLVDPAQNGIGAPADGRASGPGIAPDDGSITYSEIRAFIQRTNATTVFDSTRVADYCYSGTTWIGYDDVQSVSGKVTYAKNKGLLGYFVWAVSGDNNWVLSQRASSTWGATAVN